MALDLVLVEKGKPTDGRVSLDEREHAELMRLAAELRLGHLRRMNDYYKDHRFDARDLPALAAEVERLASHAPLALGDLVMRFAALLADGQTRGAGLQAMAD